MLELLFRADHGQTLGYEKSIEGKIVPILSDLEVKEIQEWGFDDYIKGIELFMDEYLSMKDFLDEKNIMLNNYEIISFYQQALWYDLFVIEALSKMPFSVPLHLKKLWSLLHHISGKMFLSIFFIKIV